MSDIKASKQAKKLSVISDTDFADYRVMKCKNYSISFTQDYSMLTSEHGTLWVNPEGGSIIMPEENEREINRVIFMEDYVVSFYPNQAALIRTLTGVFICATEDHFRGFYTFGLNSNVDNASRGVVLKENNQLYFVTVGAQVAHYDLAAIVEELRFKQDTWSIKNVIKAVALHDLDSKDICDADGEGFYSMTSNGVVKLNPCKAEITLKGEHQNSHIFFTTLAATKDYVCVAGYMKANKHNAIQLMTADLSKETDGPVTALAECKILFTRRPCSQHDINSAGRGIIFLG